MNAHDTITKAEYDEAVERLAEAALSAAREAVDNPDQASLETWFNENVAAAEESVDGWLTENGNPAIFGQIVAYSEAEPGEYFDWEWRLKYDGELSTPSDVVRRLASYAMFPDVLRQAQNAVRAERGEPSRRAGNC